MCWSILQNCILSKCGAVSKSLENLNGRPVVLNTSFNIRGKPIVETPLEAISTFTDNGIDYLIMGNYLLEK